jgi:hypothetical protein
MHCMAPASTRPSTQPCPRSRSRTSGQVCRRHRGARRCFAGRAARPVLRLEDERAGDALAFLLPSKWQRSAESYCSRRGHNGPTRAASPVTLATGFILRLIKCAFAMMGCTQCPGAGRRRRPRGVHARPPVVISADIECIQTVAQVPARLHGSTHVCMHRTTALDATVECSRS